ncbi:MAG: retropepsin-like aspartic protease [Myxococcales bacterium]
MRSLSLAVAGLAATLASAGLPAQAQRAAEPIRGVQAVALDLPRIRLNLSRTPGGPQLAPIDEDGGRGIDAFLDTGASGVLLPASASDAMKLARARTATGVDVQFEDVGVAGSERFWVSEPLHFSVTPFGSGAAAASGQRGGPIRLQVRSGGESALAGGFAVAGMPVMAGRVVVIDTAPLAHLETLRTTLHRPGDPTIPRAAHQVPLTYVSFDRFTRTHPAGAVSPTLEKNPVIGPSPLDPASRVRSVVLRRGANTALVTLLLDTGASSSFVSTRVAKKLGVKPGEDGGIVGERPERQFSLTLGGIGGTRDAPGFHVDRVELPTRDGAALVFADSPFLINDVRATGPDGAEFELEGVLGMNYLCPSARLEDALGDGAAAGPFRQIVIDHAAGFLGLVPAR